MSDTTVAAPAATTPSAPAPAETPVVTGTSAVEVKQSGRNAARELGKRFEQAHHAQTQPRAEDGKFVPVDTAAPAAEPAEQVLTESVTVEATAAPQAADGPPEGMVRIELPEGHPLRDQGDTHLDVPRDKERTFRAAVNAAARRAEVDAAERRVQEERVARLRLEAELKFVREQGSQFWTPEHQATYDDLARAYGQEAAGAYKRGQQQRAEGAMAEVREQADLQAVQQHWSGEGEKFRTEAYQVLPGQFPGLTQNEVDSAITMYAMEVKRVQDAAWANVAHTMSRIEFERRWAQGFRYSGDDFLAVAGDYLKTRPGVIAQSKAAIDAAALRERQIRADAEAAERDRMKNAGQRHATNPHRALGGVPTGSRTTDTTPAAPDLRAMTPEQIKRQGREAARALGASLDQARGR